MITPSFFVLESRRFFFAALGFGATWLLTKDVKLSLTVLAAVLAASWGWQLASLVIATQFWQLALTFLLIMLLCFNRIEQLAI